VKYVPELWVNLFSIGKALKNGFNIGNKGIRIHLTKGKTKMIFDRIMPTSKGFVVGIKMLLSIKDSLAVVAMTAGKKIKMQDLHKLLAHVGEDCARQTAKFYGWEVVGKFDARQTAKLLASSILVPSALPQRLVRII
jgi:hypothetical protein